MATKSSKFAHPLASGPDASKMRIRDLNLRMKQSILYIFDYGDEHRFEVKLAGTNPDAPKDIQYPRVLEKKGRAPRQYF